MTKYDFLEAIEEEWDKVCQKILKQYGANRKTIAFLSKAYDIMQEECRIGMENWVDD